MAAFAGREQSMGFALLEAVLAEVLPAALVIVAPSRSTVAAEVSAGSVGSSELRRARNSFKVNAVVVCGDLVSSLTVSASEAAGLGVIAIREGGVCEVDDFASPSPCLHYGGPRFERRD